MGRFIEFPESSRRTRYQAEQIWLRRLLAHGVGEHLISVCADASDSSNRQEGASLGTSSCERQRPDQPGLAGHLQENCMGTSAPPHGRPFAPPCHTQLPHACGTPSARRGRVVSTPRKYPGHRHLLCSALHGMLQSTPFCRSACTSTPPPQTTPNNHTHTLTYSLACLFLLLLFFLPLFSTIPHDEAHTSPLYTPSLHGWRLPHAVGREMWGTTTTTTTAPHNTTTHPTHTTLPDEQESLMTAASARTQAHASYTGACMNRTAANSKPTQQTAPLLTWLLSTRQNHSMTYPGSRREEGIRLRPLRACASITTTTTTTLSIHHAPMRHTPATHRHQYPPHTITLYQHKPTQFV